MNTGITLIISHILAKMLCNEMLRLILKHVIFAFTFEYCFLLRIVSYVSGRLLFVLFSICFEWACQDF